MSLYTVEFKTYQMLRDMLELSSFKRMKYFSNKEVDTIPSGQYLEVISTGFNFGRQSGHTEAAINFLKNNKKAYMVVHNGATKHMITWNHPNLSDRVLYQNTYQNKFGLKGLDIQYLIFDVISFNDAMEFFMHNTPWIIPQKIKSICFIGLPEEKR